MSIFKVLFGIILNTAIFGALLLAPAGTLDWWRAWVFLGVSLLSATVSTLTLFRVNQELLAERFKPPVQQGQPFSDKVLVLLFITAFLAWIIFIPLDVFELHFLNRPSLIASSSGLVIFVAGWLIITLAFLENTYAVPVVRHQAERYQTVVDTGVYRIVRHPLYAGLIPFMIGMALWFESYAAALLVIIPISILTVRILFEERFLRRELRGYDSYTKRVRYRLIPFLW